MVNSDFTGWVPSPARSYCGDQGYVIIWRHPLSRTIAQTELRNNDAKEIQAVSAGETFIVARGRQRQDPCRPTEPRHSCVGLVGDLQNACAPEQSVKLAHRCGHHAAGGIDQIRISDACCDEGGCRERVHFFSPRRSPGPASAEPMTSSRENSAGE